jgi:DNA-binding MarR family transcriptional regulator
MTATRLHDNLHWLLVRVSLSSKHNLMRIADEHGLNVMQIFTLFYLEPGAQMPMHAISGILSCDPSNVTAIVDRLVAGSFIERNENAADRRVKAIALTPAGEALRRLISEQMIKENVPDLSTLSESETKTLKKLLLKIAPDNDTQ